MNLIQSEIISNVTKSVISYLIPKNDLIVLNKEVLEGKYTTNNITGIISFEDIDIGKTVVFEYEPVYIGGVE